MLRPAGLFVLEQDMCSMNSPFSSLFGRKGFRTSVIANFPFLYMWQRKTLEAFAFPLLFSSQSRRGLCYFLVSWTSVGFGVGARGRDGEKWIGKGKRRKNNMALNEKWDGDTWGPRGEHGTGLKVGRGSGPCLKKQTFWEKRDVSKCQ